jgi:integrase/recombinase XerD
MTPALRSRRLPELAVVSPNATDAQLVDLWLHGRSPHTRRAYRADVDRFRAFVVKPLPTVTLG